MGVRRIERLSREHEARFEEWADRWIAIGLETAAADRERFEGAMRDWYRYAGLDWPGVVVWVPSPLVLALAAPAAAGILDARQTGRRLVRGIDAGEAIADAVTGTV